MKNLLIAVFGIMAWNTTSAQFIAVVEMKEPLEGICNNDEVYALFPGLTGQVAAESEVSKEELLKMLNEIPFLTANPKFKAKGMISFFVNCEGEMLGCEMDRKNSTGNAELDAQIVEVFKKLKTWKPGTLNGNNVDSSLLYSFEVRKGKITF
jgi:hypothetical protein